MSSEFKSENFDGGNCRRTRNFAGSRHTLFTDPEGVNVLVVRSSLSGGGAAVNLDALLALLGLDRPSYIRAINDHTGGDFFSSVEELPSKQPREGRNGRFVIFDPIDFDGEDYPPPTQTGQTPF